MSNSRYSRYVSSENSQKALYRPVPHVEIARILSRGMDRFKNPDSAEPVWAGPFCILETKAVVTSLLSECEFSSGKLEDLHTRLDDLRSGFSEAYVSPTLKEDIAQAALKLDEIPTGVVFKWKNAVVVTPESYLEACQTLGIPPWSSYSYGHKAYIRKLATCHPDRIEQMTLESLPKKPPFSPFSFFLRRGNANEDYLELKKKLDENPTPTESEKIRLAELKREFLRTHHLAIRWELNDKIEKQWSRLEGTPENDPFDKEFRDSFCVQYFGMSFREFLCEKFSYVGEETEFYEIYQGIPEALREPFERFRLDLRKYQSRKFSETAWARNAFEAELAGRYAVTVDELEAVEEWGSEQVENWNRLHHERSRDIGEKFAQNRDAYLKAWEMFQAYQGVCWEDAKNIDIIWGIGSWGKSGSLYKKIDLDRTDAIIVSAYMDPVGLHGDQLWFELEYDYQNGDFHRRESEFSKVIRKMEKSEYPEWLKDLILLLESRDFNERKIKIQARRLLDSSFQKPVEFDRLMQAIENYPEQFSEGVTEIPFEPTLLFAQELTWDYGLYPQDYRIPLWLIFSHLYLSTTGNIPFRLGEKFLRKYLPSLSVHEMGEILEKMRRKENPETFFQSQYQACEEEQRDIYETCKKNGWNFSYLVSNTWSSISLIYAGSEIRTQNGKIIWPKELVLPLYERYVFCEETKNNIELLENVIREIYTGPNVVKLDDISDTERPSRLGAEVSTKGGLSLYFPINTAWGARVDGIHFTEKEVATMYLATLESPILDSMSKASRLLSVNKERESTSA